MVADGFPDLAGETILDRRRSVEAAHDDLRTALLLEPRGHADTDGALLIEAVSAEADLGVLFATDEGDSTTCGHRILALGTVLVETGMSRGPADGTGRVRHARRTRRGDRGARVDVPGYGVVEYDLAYGGAFYAYCDVDQFDRSLTRGDADAIRQAGMAVKRAVADAATIEHPRSADLAFLYGTILREPPEDSANDGWDVCVFADGQIDRSPTGTGVSGRVALASDRGDLDAGERPAVVPRVAGSAHVTGRSEFALGRTQ